MSNTSNNYLNAATQQRHIIIIGDKAKITKQNSHKWLHAALTVTAQRKSYTTLVLFPLLLTKFHVITLTTLLPKSWFMPRLIVSNLSRDDSKNSCYNHCSVWESQTGWTCAGKCQCHIAYRSTFCHSLKWYYMFITLAQFINIKLKQHNLNKLNYEKFHKNTSLPRTCTQSMHVCHQYWRWP